MANHDCLSTSECTGLLQICLFVVRDLVASESLYDVRHSIGTDYRGHSVLKRHLPTHHLVSVLPCHNLTKNREVAPWLRPNCSEVEERLNQAEHPHVVEG